MSDNPLDTFGRNANPSPALQRRVERTLRQRGYLSGAPLMWRSIGLAASLLVAAGLGFGAGRIRPEPLAHEGREYLLLLREDSTYRDDRPVNDIVREYGRWADSLRRNNLLVTAAKLGDEELSVVAPDVSLVPESLESPTSGFFVVRAPSLDAARAIAAASPHVKYGGRIVVRSVE
jgi:hypothetical protein